MCACGDTSNSMHTYMYVTDSLVICDCLPDKPPTVSVLAIVYCVPKATAILPCKIQRKRSQVHCNRQMALTVATTAARCYEL